MTTIIGYITQERVIFCADRQRNSLSLNGDFQSVNSSSMRKIYKLSDRISIAAGGVTVPIEVGIENILKEIDSEQNDIFSLIELCKKHFSIALKDFVDAHPGISYKNLYFFIGGIIKGETFLYTLRNDQDFTPVNYQPIQLVTMGDGHREISATLPKQLEAVPQLLNEKYYLYSKFSKAIRDCSQNHDTTGPETYLVQITKMGYEERYIDNTGKLNKEL